MHGATIKITLGMCRNGVPVKFLVSFYVICICMQERLGKNAENFYNFLTTSVTCVRKEWFIVSY